VQGESDPWRNGLPLAGGAAQQVKAKAAVRVELIGWGLGDATVDPGEVLLRLVTQSAAGAERYAMLLEEAYARYVLVIRRVDCPSGILGWDPLGKDQRVIRPDTAETARRGRSSALTPRIGLGATECEASCAPGRLDARAEVNDQTEWAPVPMTCVEPATLLGHPH
jgi:hypothetical protein